MMMMMMMIIFVMKVNVYQVDIHFRIMDDSIVIIKYLKVILH
jgi:hypothetical protein